MSQEQPKNKQPAPEYVSIAQAEKAEKDRQEALIKLRKKIDKVTDNLKKEGYDFEMTETSDEFLVKIGDRTTHLIKSENFLLESKDEQTNAPVKTTASLEEMIESGIRSPKENSYAAVLELRKQKNEPNN
ncbi:MAG: hypothetical protein Q8P07_05770 [bacterium]|nr:hypothetical protein [bacterium]